MLHNDGSKRDGVARAIEMLDLVEIPSAAKRAHEFPHQFSGGMRQCAMIAMALVNNPSLLIADEPTTALDVTVQAQILQLLQNMQKEFNMGVILITHDLGVVIPSHVLRLAVGALCSTGEATLNNYSRQWLRVQSSQFGRHQFALRGRQLSQRRCDSFQLGLSHGRLLYDPAHMRRYTQYPHHEAHLVILHHDLRTQPYFF